MGAKIQVVGGNLPIMVTRRVRSWEVPGRSMLRIVPLYGQRHRLLGTVTLSSAAHNIDSFLTPCSHEVKRGRNKGMRLDISSELYFDVLEVTLFSQIMKTEELAL
jgi:hypothetical protein